jgi:DNA polymerase I-like protein with 3'-5' exonuclease and polymerase domains
VIILKLSLELLGQLAEDPKYIQTYKTNLDLHKETAAQMFNVPLEYVTIAPQ